MMTTSPTRPRASDRRVRTGLAAIALLLVTMGIAFYARDWLLDKVRLFNRRYLNPFTVKSAGGAHSYYAALTHTGRRSGRTYATPVVAERARSWDGFVVPLPYGERTDWCRNVLAAGRCSLMKGGVVYQCVDPVVARGEDAFPELPLLISTVLRLFGVNRFLTLRRQPRGELELSGPVGDSRAHRPGEPLLVPVLTRRG